MPTDDDARRHPRSVDDFDVEIGDGFVVLRPRGDLDHKKSGACRSLLAELVAEHAVVIVDLDLLDYMDSSGLGSLMMSYRLARERGNRLAIVCNAQRFRRSFEIRGLNAAIPLYWSVEEVLADGGAPGS